MINLGIVTPSPIKQSKYTKSHRGNAISILTGFLL